MLLTLQVLPFRFPAEKAKDKGKGLKMKKAVIIGAGQTGRGFIAPILQENGYELVFLDKDQGLAGLHTGGGGTGVARKAMMGFIGTELPKHSLIKTLCPAVV